MPESKTKPTAASVDEYLASRASPAQLVDCRALIAICERVTKQPPVMWGASIVGFGRYHYTYDSGHSGDMCLTGLAVRGRELVVYVTTDNTEALVARLGKHRRTAACLYIKRLADIDVDVLEQLIAESVAAIRHRYRSDAT
ncbi:DUF1801 domain-containing protein [Gemmatimonas sp.]